jgi:hypothetical protein
MRYSRFITSGLPVIRERTVKGSRIGHRLPAGLESGNARDHNQPSTPAPHDAELCVEPQLFSRADEVKSLSPHHRFLVALHSPNGVLETGLRVCPSEKKVAKLAYNLQGDTFSRPY